ncbi:hypothetical protein N1851_033574 [Merluccius polli]|uniref:Uncharacterized protein n=1 Tax=Merluccius polli TaxID=89951 RepID=A0AA47M136_MERPO|nr:hypothetical protein N1851_033574 [Merluccius polli]
MAHLAAAQAGVALLTKAYRGTNLLSNALPLEPALTSPDDLTHNLNTNLAASLNTLAPLKTKTVSFNTSSPWFTPELSYKIHHSTYKDSLTATKSAYFSSIINDSNRNPQALFSTVNNLLKPRPKPLSTSTPELSTLARPAAETLIHAFISSYLDYCNSLLYGITASLINRLQLESSECIRPTPNLRNPGTTSPQS